MRPIMDEGTKNVAFFILGRIADFMSSVHSPKAFLEGNVEGNRALTTKNGSLPQYFIALFLS